MPLPEEGGEDAVFDPQTTISDGPAPPPDASTEFVPPPDQSFSEEEEPDQGEADRIARDAQHEANQPKSFDPSFREPFEGLLFLGSLTETFEWLGHEFTVRTLTTGELMAIGLIHKEYIGTLGDTKAYQTAVVAACLERVDGQPLPIPPDLRSPSGSDDVVVLRDRFRYISRNWFPPTIDHIYEQFILLEAESARVIEQLGNP